MSKKNNKEPSKFSSFFDTSKKSCLIFINLLFFLTLVTILSKTVWELHFHKNSEFVTANHVTFTISKNQQLKEILKDLEAKKIIPSKEVFSKWVKRWNIDRKIRSGKFRIYPNESLFHIMMKLSTSLAFIEKITIQEGLTIHDTARLFEPAGINTKRFIKLCHEEKFIRDLGFHTESLEGYLFPDTYQISYASSEEKLIKMMVKRFRQVLNSINPEGSIIHKTTGLNQGLIIASIIEKESSYIPERPKIASVFWNRLKEGWRLDSDVTVRYALKKWDGAITKKDLKTSSPYNTRKYKGLPPTPICNPGKSALSAAFYPEQTRYMFFVASGEEDGKSYFSKTLRDHNKIVKKLRKKGKID